jgi:hypothetical protein
MNILGPNYIFHDSTAGTTAADVDQVAVSYRPGLDWHRKLGYGLKLAKRV